MKIMFSTKNPVLTLNNGVYSKERNILGNEMISVNICGAHVPKEFSETMSVPGKIIIKNLKNGGYFRSKGKNFSGKLALSIIYAMNESLQYQAL